MGGGFILCQALKRRCKIFTEKYTVLWKRGTRLSKLIIFEYDYFFYLSFKDWYHFFKNGNCRYVVILF